MSNNTEQSQQPEDRPIHYLPAPGDGDSTGAIRLNAGTDTTVKFDTLGPMVVNKDGTLSRIANWHKMTEVERQRTMRVLSARNQIRLAEQREAQEAAEGSPS